MQCNCDFTWAAATLATLVVKPKRSKALGCFIVEAVRGAGNRDLRPAHRPDRKGVAIALCMIIEQCYQLYRPKTKRQIWLRGLKHRGRHM